MAEKGMQLNTCGRYILVPQEAKGRRLLRRVEGKAGSRRLERAGGNLRPDDLTREAADGWHAKPAPRRGHDSRRYAGHRRGAHRRRDRTPADLRAGAHRRRLVLADVIILLLGVIARYVFQHPLIWTDDLAQAVFLWLGMIGSVVALNRGEHMRMTALLARAKPPARMGLETYGAAVGLLFLAAVVQPSIEYVRGGDPPADARPRRVEGLADGAAADRLRADDRHRRRPPVPHLSRLGRRACSCAGRLRRLGRAAGRPVAGVARQHQSAAVLRRSGRRVGACRRADFDRLRVLDLRLPGA